MGKKQRYSDSKENIIIDFLLVAEVGRRKWKEDKYKGKKTACQLETFQYKANS